MSDHYREERREVIARYLAYEYEQDIAPARVRAAELLAIFDLWIEDERHDAVREAAQRRRSPETFTVPFGALVRLVTEHEEDR